MDVLWCFVHNFQTHLFFLTPVAYTFSPFSPRGKMILQCAFTLLPRSGGAVVVLRQQQQPCELSQPPLAVWHLSIRICAMHRCLLIQIKRNEVLFLHRRWHMHASSSICFEARHVSGRWRKRRERTPVYCVLRWPPSRVPLSLIAWWTNGEKKKTLALWRWKVKCLKWLTEDQLTLDDRQWCCSLVQ